MKKHVKRDTFLPWEKPRYRLNLNRIPPKIKYPIIIWIIALIISCIIAAIEQQIRAVIIVITTPLVVLIAISFISPLFWISLFILSIITWPFRVIKAFKTAKKIHKQNLYSGGHLRCPKCSRKINDVPKGGISDLGLLLGVVRCKCGQKLETSD